MSTVIKAGEAGPLLRRLSTVDLADYVQEGRGLVLEAKRRAASIIEDASRESERLREVARREGHEAGHAKGEEEGRRTGHDTAYAESLKRFEKENATVVRDLQRAIDELDAIQDNVRETAERDLLSLAVKVASKLTFAIGEVHREAAARNLDRVLALIGTKDVLVVHVNPADLESIRTYAKSALQHARTSSMVSIEPDDRMAPGGCKVTGRRIEIDATLETQVDELVSLLIGGRNKDG